MGSSTSESNALEATLTLLNSLLEKNFENFQKSFHPDPKSHFVDILPDGKRVYSSKELISIHPTFFDHPETVFQPIDRSDIFTKEHIDYQFAENEFYQAGLDVRVTKPKILSQKDQQVELETIYDHISLTFVFDRKYQKWYPRLITNTIIRKDHYLK